VNNAGGSRPFPLHAPEEDWEEALTLNFTRPRQLSLLLVDQMIELGRAGSSTSRENPSRRSEWSILRQGGDARLFEGSIS